MPNPYRELLKVSGLATFLLTGFVARLPMAMVAIGIITMLARLRGSFGLASAVSSTYVMTAAFVAPLVSRWADRLGQRKVLPVAALTSTTGLLALAACTHWRAAEAWLFACAALAGCKPSMPAMVRARWTVMLAGAPELRTAYALESVLDEACFIVGPPLAVGLSVYAFAQAGTLGAAALLTLGVFAFIAQGRGEPPATRHPQPRPATGSKAKQAIVRRIAYAMLGLGMVTGTVDVASVAFATQLGAPVAASILLGVYAGGSFGAGLLFGALQGETPLPRLLLRGGIAAALSTLPLMFAPGIVGLSILLLCAGLTVAPTMIAGMALVEACVPRERLTEALTWLITGLNIGIAAGAVCAGRMVDRYGARAGFGVALVGGAVTLCAAWHVARHRSDEADSSDRALEA